MGSQEETLEDSSIHEAKIQASDFLQQFQTLLLLNTNSIQNYKQLREMEDILNLQSEFDRACLTMLSNEKYNLRVQDMMAQGKSRLEVIIDDFANFNTAFPNLIKRSPRQCLQSIETALNGIISGIIEYGKVQKENKYSVTLQGNFGVNSVSPRGLGSQLLNQLVKVQGIVTRLSVRRPKMMKSTHYCATTEKFHYKTYADQYDIFEQDANRQNNALLTYDSNGNALTPEYGLFEYKDHQVVVIQEFPEKSPPGQLPRTVEISLEEDLVDTAKPGDRIEVVGIYKPLANGSFSKTGLFKCVVLATGVQLINTLSNTAFKPSDIRAIREISNRPDAIEILSASLAPSIAGHNQIKKAALLQLLGGTERNLPNGTHLRGDINVLLIGDPSTAKSQILRSVMNVAPLVTNTTGRGASGVGLTAAVTFDPESRERTLTAGAMVLADRGVVCIDEFDKMNDLDRVAIHEVMEQQTVTISKAGMHVSLNARCSVLAAANPLYGNYQRNYSPSVNIGLPDSLLSRFDLMFIVLDQHVSEIDREISEQVILNHMIAGVLNMDIVRDGYNAVIEPEMQNYQDSDDPPVFYQYGLRELISIQFLKKYIKYAKQLTPILTPEASEQIAMSWGELRMGESFGKATRIMPITVRTLETLVRLSTAMAKVQLSQQVEVSHVVLAYQLLRYAIYYEETPENIQGQLEQNSQNLQKIQISPGQKRKRQEDSPQNVANQLVRLQTPVRLDSKKFVYRIITALVNNSDSQKASLEDIFKSVQENDQHSMIKDWDQYVSIIKALDHQTLIMFSESDNQVYLV